MQITTHSDDSVGAIGETGLIQSIKKWLGPVTPATPYGMGDDCAVLPASAQAQVITTDALSYGLHFDASVRAQDAGAKLIKRNLSDIAAMGGTPQHAVLALLCGPDISLAWLEAFFRGVCSACIQYELKIVGGDVSALPPGQFSAVLTLLGSAASPRRRDQAQSGDWVYVTGQLGGSIIKKHWNFTPRLEEGRWLAQRCECSSLMDLTDGLAKDLKALIPSGCAAELELEQIPLAADAQRCADRTHRSALEHAFCDGEDYELLFTIRQTEPLGFEQAWAERFPQVKLSRIGRVCLATQSAPYINAVNRQPIPWTQGFEHLTPA
jgi:thiamine-monophosphate kinase